jgi:type IV secretory pathway TrbD component
VKVVTFAVGYLLLAVWLAALLGFGLGWFLAVTLYGGADVEDEREREFLLRRREHGAPHDEHAAARRQLG